MPLRGECNAYKPVDLNKSYCVGTWNAHDESIWELVHHPFKVIHWFYYFNFDETNRTFYYLQVLMVILSFGRQLMLQVKWTINVM